MSGYKKLPLVSASVTKDKNSIHCISEVDITKPRNLIKKHFEKQEKNFR